MVMFFKRWRRRIPPGRAWLRAVNHHRFTDQRAKASILWSRTGSLFKTIIFSNKHFTLMCDHTDGKLRHKLCNSLWHHISTSLGFNFIRVPCFLYVFAMITPIPVFERFRLPICKSHFMVTVAATFGRIQDPFWFIGYFKFSWLGTGTTLKFNTMVRRLTNFHRPRYFPSISMGQVRTTQNHQLFPHQVWSCRCTII